MGVAKPPLWAKGVVRPPSRAKPSKCFLRVWPYGVAEPTPGKMGWFGYPYFFFLFSFFFSKKKNQNLDLILKINILMGQNGVF
jgi:hypothetical protein